MARKISKEAILESTIKVIHENGIDKFSIDSVVKECKISKGSLYNYFSSKEDLFYRTAESIIDERVSLLRKISQKDLSRKEKIKLFIWTINEMSKKNRDKIEIYNELMFGTSKSLRKKIANLYYEKYVNELEKILEIDNMKGDSKYSDKVDYSIGLANIIDMKSINYADKIIFLNRILMALSK